MPRTMAALLIGMALGAVTTLATVALSGGWYEYHLLDTGDDPHVLINQQGWELTLRDGPVWQLRRPRLRIR